jgi:hypothetical protein
MIALRPRYVTLLLRGGMHGDREAQTSGLEDERLHVVELLIVHVGGSIMHYIHVTSLPRLMISGQIFRPMAKRMRFLGQQAAENAAQGLG